MVQAELIFGQPSERLEPRCRHEPVDAVGIGDRCKLRGAVAGEAVQHTVVGLVRAAGVYGGDDTTTSRTCWTSAMLVRERCSGPW